MMFCGCCDKEVDRTSRPMLAGNAAGVSLLYDRRGGTALHRRAVEQPIPAGEASRFATLITPADSPKIVTLPESPPNAAKLSCTQPSANSWSRRPRLSGAVEGGEPGDVQPIVDRHQHDAVAGERDAVVGRDGVAAAGTRAAVDPHHHRQPWNRGLGVQTFTVQVLAESGQKSSRRPRPSSYPITTPFSSDAHALRSLTPESSTLMKNTTSGMLGQGRASSCLIEPSL